MTKESAPDKTKDAPYEAIRSRILNAKPADVGISVSGDEPVWGVVMDVGFPKMTATLIALSDGSTSLYFSTGGGFIGGGQHASVVQATALFLAEAQPYCSQMPLTTSFPPPASGKTRFYLLTSDGVRTAEASGKELGEGRHELSPLFKKGDEVITAFRLCTQKKQGVAVRDKTIQALFYALSIGLGILIGGLAAPERLPGMFMGGFLGLIVGFLGSGILLMVMQSVRSGSAGKG